MKGRYTNVAPLWMAASHMLQATGRLQEHELWDGTPEHRVFVERQLMECATQIADWFGCDLVKRQPATVTILPLDVEEEAA